MEGRKWGGGGGGKKTRGERISHKVGSMHYRRREGEGADLELKLISLSPYIKVPWIPSINHYIKLSCWCMQGQKCSSHFYDSSPLTYTYSPSGTLHPRASCNEKHAHTEIHTAYSFTIPFTLWQ